MSLNLIQTLNSITYFSNTGWPKDQALAFSHHLSQFSEQLGKEDADLKDKINNLVTLLTFNPDSSKIDILKLTAKIKAFAPPLHQTTEKEQETKKSQEDFILEFNAAKQAGDGRKAFSILKRMPNWEKESKKLLDLYIISAKQSDMWLRKTISATAPTLGKAEKFKAAEYIHLADFLGGLDIIANRSVTTLTHAHKAFFQKWAIGSPQIEMVPIASLVTRFFKLLNSALHDVQVVEQLCTAAAEILKEAQNFAAPMIYNNFPKQNQPVDRMIYSDLKGVCVAPLRKRKELNKICKKAVAKQAYRFVLHTVYTVFANLPERRHYWISKIPKNILNQLIQEVENPLFIYQLKYDFYNTPENAIDYLKRAISKTSFAALQYEYNSLSYCLTEDVDRELRSWLIR